MVRDREDGPGSEFVGGGSRAQLGRDREDGPGSEMLEEEVGFSSGEIERIAQVRRHWRRK